MFIAIVNLLVDILVIYLVIALFFFIIFISVNLTLLDKDGEIIYGRDRLIGIVIISLQWIRLLYIFSKEEDDADE